MAKHMITASGELIKVNQFEAARLFISGQASYMSKDEFRLAMKMRETRGKTETAMARGYPCPPVGVRFR